MEDQLDNNILDQAIEVTQDSSSVIPTNKSYVPVEELFNTPEYDEYIDSSDMAGIQQLEEGSKGLDDYGISALANFGVYRPTLATESY